MTHKTLFVAMVLAMAASSNAYSQTAPTAEPCTPAAAIMGQSGTAHPSAGEGGASRLTAGEGGASRLTAGEGGIARQTAGETHLAANRGCMYRLPQEPMDRPPGAPASTLLS